MNTKEKQLLLIDLCARLPYGVITKNCKNNFDVPAHLLPHLNGIKLLIDEYDLKPYLRPMSSMTEDEKEEYTKVIESLLWTNELDFFNKYHFDYRGLISMGLALEAPENMYV